MLQLQTKQQDSLKGILLLHGPEGPAWCPVETSGKYRDQIWTMNYCTTRFVYSICLGETNYVCVCDLNGLNSWQGAGNMQHR